MLNIENVSFIDESTSLHKLVTMVNYLSVRFILTNSRILDVTGLHSACCATSPGQKRL